MAVTAQRAIGQDSVEDGYVLFFTDQYRNPAVISSLQTHSIGFQSLAEAEFKVKNYLMNQSANISVPGTRNNIGIFYQQHEQPWASKQKMGIHLGRHFSVNDDGLLSIGGNLTYYQRKELFFSKEKPKFPDQIHPMHGFVYATDEPLMNDSFKQAVFTESIGIWYSDPRYYAGISVEDFLVFNKPNVDSRMAPNFPLIVNATFARHFRWDNTVVTPKLNYHYQTKEESVHYNPLDAHHFHQINPGLMARFNDKVVAGVGTNMELTRAYGERHFWNNYQVRFGLRFWKRLWIATQLRFPQSLFGPDDDRMSVGLNINWLLPQNALESE